MSGKVNLDRWSPHLAAAKREGKTLTQYARSRGPSRHTLYAARQMLRCAGGKSSVEHQPHWLLEGIDLEAMRTHRMLRYRRAS